ncbi:MAG: TIGR00366 family protein [Brumimicrobium sp.]|nr:TIGR00366 family protein [Brumimicrobium sp.]
MTRISQKYTEVFKKILPSPFTIAVLLTLFTIILALFLTKPDDEGYGNYLVYLLTSWESGLWDDSAGGLYFAFQMMLILVLGHVLALTPQINRLIKVLLSYCKDTPSSVFVVAFGAIVMGLFNWGLGLIFGAILARKVGEKFAALKRPVNYGMVGAAAYATMMVWHGGLSGSATTKAMESGYIPEMMRSMGTSGNYPEFIPFESTIGSITNIIVSLLCITVIPLFLYFLSKRSGKGEVLHFQQTFGKDTESYGDNLKGAEKLDASKIFGMLLGTIILLIALYKAFTYEGISRMGFINLNFINLSLLGLALFFHRSIFRFSAAVQQAIGDISGILIQFPLYFGILGIMKSSGLIELFSDGIIQVATDYSLPFFTFISAGLVNFFVPSGGGQWAIQGPILIEAASQLNADLPKTILAMAYGDQLTNMLQPFWALPLLGITGLKPHQILPYTFVLFLLGLVIFGSILLVDF